MQAAQPVTFGHHCMAYVEMFARDLSRVQDAIRRMDEKTMTDAEIDALSGKIVAEVTKRTGGVLRA